MLTTLDYLIIAAYLGGVAVFGIRMAGKQTSTADYFLGGRDLPWWVVCFSVVATETSTLTIIGIPAVAYGGTLTFLQLTLGYLIGRTVVAFVLLPRFYDSDLPTTYAFLGRRYGDAMRAAAAGTFLFTRLLADGIRLFASAIPLKVIAAAAGLQVGYFEIIFVIVFITVIYTYIGGIKAVVWMDVVQLTIYLAAGVIAIALLLGEVPSGWWTDAVRENKTLLFDLGLDLPFAAWFSRPYLLQTAVIGGAVFSVASHGADQLMVQRLLACRSLRDSQKAVIGSAFLVMVQFALFLFVGLLLWSYYKGATPAELGLSRGDEIFPLYIIDGLPAGVSGLLLAGIIAAAMSTLSSSLNSLASSSMLDLYQRFRKAPLDDDRALKISRRLTLFWGVVLVGFASLFESTENPVVELGLTIASFTYGGLLGVFLLGILNKSSQQVDALIAFAATIVTMICVIFGVWYSAESGWIFFFNPAEAVVQERGLVPIAWPWFPVIGASVTVAVGSVSAMLRRRWNRQTRQETSRNSG